MGHEVWNDREHTVVNVEVSVQMFLICMKTDNRDNLIQYIFTRPFLKSDVFNIKKIMKQRKSMEDSLHCTKIYDHNQIYFMNICLNFQLHFI